MARTHVVLDDKLLKAIDRVAGNRGRSRFLGEAAREKLERAELEKALDATFGIAKGPGYAHWKDARTAARWVREGRRAGKRK